MRLHVLLAAAGVVATLTAGAAGAAGADSPPIPRQPVSLSSLQWLSGCWKRTTAERVVEEQWMAPAGGVMLGMSRTVSAKDGRLVEFEQVRIEARGDSAVYVALPSRQAMAEFVAIEFDDTHILFENKAHDFPQRVGYRLAGPDSLAAWIEGPGRDGKTRRIDFPYRRATCPAGRP